MQSGGSLTYNNKKTGLTTRWKASRNQEYSVLEANLMNKLKVTPKDSFLSKNGYVRDVINWWQYYLKSGPMEKSFHKTITDYDVFEIPEVILLLNQIIERRLQDLEKINAMSSGDSTLNYTHFAYIHALQTAMAEARIIYSIRIAEKQKPKRTKTKSIPPSPSLSPPNLQVIGSPSL